MPLAIRPDYQAFIGRNVEKYILRFEKFDDLAGNFKPTWHWPAFFFGWVWFLYRKMYLWALIDFVIYFIPYLNFAAFIARGLVGHWLYYRTAQARLASVRRAFDDENQVLARLGELGGVHAWVPWLALALVILFFVITISFGLLAAIVAFFAPTEASI